MKRKIEACMKREIKENIYLQNLSFENIGVKFVFLIGEVLQTTL
jgi:hypothetical protein